MFLISPEHLFVLSTYTKPLEESMRRAAVLMALLLVLAACAETTDDDSDDTATPEPTPTEEIAEEPEPTPEPTATPVPEDEDDATLDDDEEDDATVDPDTDDATADTADLDEQIDQIIENVIEMRGLELLEDLELTFMTREELTEFMEENVEIEQHEIDRDWLLRLIPDPDADIEQKLIDVQAADVAGFYDAETGQTVVVSEGDELTAAEQTILAHEIVHALQDQHYDLTRLETLESDAAMAFLSMLEGDAVISQERYAETYLDEDQQMEYQQEMMAAQQDEATMEAMMAIPSYYLETFVFPYIAGPEFMSHVLEDDLSAMDEFIENPPTSTHQVLNGQSYLAGEIDDPVEVEPQDIDERLDDSWEIAYDDTFGAFNLFMILFENNAPDPGVAISGWSGDWLEVYVSDQDQTLVALSTTWEDEDQAVAYEEQLLETMAEYDEEDGVLIGDDRYHVVVQDGERLDLMSSTDPDTLLDAAQMN
jgi:hypothetical protein